jgi:hypothetical protein
MIDKNFFKEMEKIAIPIGSLISVGLTASSIKGNITESLNKSRLKPQGHLNSYKLSSPYNYQFEGGKYNNASETMHPTTAT